MDLKKEIERTKSELEFIENLKKDHPHRTLTRIERDLKVKLKTLESL